MACFRHSRCSQSGLADACVTVCPCRAYDLPFQRHMGLPYTDFVLNIQPDDYQQLNEKIQFFLDNPARLRRMQVPHLPHDVPHASSYLVKP